MSQHSSGAVALPLSVPLSLSPWLPRDVKSPNVLLTKEGVAKVADVGLASMTDYFSTAGSACGTFTYAAPELLMGFQCTPKVCGSLSLQAD